MIQFLQMLLPFARPRYRSKNDGLISERDLLLALIICIALVTYYIKWLVEFKEKGVIWWYFLCLAIVEGIEYLMNLENSVLVWTFVGITVFVKICLMFGVELRAVRKVPYWELSGWEFEKVCASVLKKAGYKKVEVTKGSGDLGVDIIFFKDKIKYIAQCKHYKSKVTPEPVRALWGVKGDFQADKVVMIASSGVTDMAYDFIKSKPNYLLWTLDDIVLMEENIDKSNFYNKLVEKLKKLRDHLRKKEDE